MRLSAHKLSQPTVFAKTFFLLIVMNLVQVWCENPDKNIVRLYHDASQGHVTMFNSGRVKTCPNFSMNGCWQIDFAPNRKKTLFILSIYNLYTKKFLCINKHGKPIGKRVLSRRCQFRESFITGTNGFLWYQLITKKGEAPIMLSFDNKGKPSSKKSIFSNILKATVTSAMCPEPVKNVTASAHKIRHHRHNHVPDPERAAEERCK